MLGPRSRDTNSFSKEHLREAMTQVSNLSKDLLSPAQGTGSKQGVKDTFGVEPCYEKA